MVGAIPVGINWIMALLFGEPVGIATLLGGGELLLLSFGLLLGALGDIIGSRPGWDKPKRAASGLCAAVVLVIGIVYVPATYEELFVEPPSASAIGVVSLGLYTLSLVVSLTALYAARESGNVRFGSSNSVDD